MKLLFLLLTCLPCLAQFPYSGTTWSTAQAAASFNPNSFSPILWVDIDSNKLNHAGSSSPANNDTIKQWTDCSSNGRDLTQTGGATVEPTYKTTLGPSGGPCIDFPGGTSNMNLTNRNVTSYSQPNTFFLVMNEAGGDVCILNPAADQNEQLNDTVATGMSMYAGSSVSIGNRLNGAGRSGWGVVTLEFNGASSAIYSNHIAALSGVNPGAGAMKGFTLGSYFNGTGPANLLVTDVIWYNQVFSTSDRRKVEAWLGSKRGITIQP